MVKKIIVFFILILCAGIILLLLKKSSNIVPTGLSHSSPSTAAVKRVPTGQAKTANIIEKRSIFVPYWDLANLSSLTAYDRVMYFGLTPTVNGFNTKDAAYQGLGTLVKGVPQGKEVYVTVELFNNNSTKEILESREIQQKIIADIIDIVNQYKLRGVALDLEINDIVDTTVKDNISNFVQLLYISLKTNNSRLLVALYGDLFYRKRPYDVSSLAKNSDEIMVMAYDFHKAGGEPGPNFPLSGRDNYGYDFREMVDDFLQFVPPQKLSIVFGMFGYVWEVDQKKRPLKPARALSYLDIKKQFLDNCIWKDCLVRRDAQSAETEIDYITDYTDPDPVTNPDKLITPLGHIVWFEDQASVNKKIEYLNSKPIGSVIYWVWGYF